MNKAIEKELKEFIETYIDYIDDNDFVAVFRYAEDECYNNEFVSELIEVFDEAGIDVSEGREAYLYEMLLGICGACTSTDENNVHMQLDYISNWAGYSIEEVISYLERWAINLRVNLIPKKNRIFINAPNYKIEWI